MSSLRNQGVGHGSGRRAWKRSCGWVRAARISRHREHGGGIPREKGLVVTIVGRGTFVRVPELRTRERNKN